MNFILHLPFVVGAKGDNKYLFKRHITWKEMFALEMLPALQITH